MLRTSLHRFHPDTGNAGGPARIHPEPHPSQGAIPQGRLRSAAQELETPPGGGFQGQRIGSAGPGRSRNDRSRVDPSRSDGNDRPGQGPGPSQERSEERSDRNRPKGRGTAIFVAVSRTGRHERGQGLPGNHQGTDRSDDDRQAHPQGRSLQVQKDVVRRFDADGQQLQAVQRRSQYLRTLRRESRTVSEHLVCFEIKKLLLRQKCAKSLHPEKKSSESRSVRGPISMRGFCD
mmetsp:Transcript_11322/g.32622  ORF Transcript_11322/g.32622 Transcript_11322/m.32622 type:complete len:233 (-) Transcript_11322:76-774(-)